VRDHGEPGVPQQGRLRDGDVKHYFHVVDHVLEVDDRFTRYFA
jgi:hypothetical protein